MQTVALTSDEIRLALRTRRSETEPEWSAECFLLSGLTHEEALNVADWLRELTHTLACGNGGELARTQFMEPLFSELRERCGLNAAGALSAWHPSEEMLTVPDRIIAAYHADSGPGEKLYRHLRPVLMESFYHHFPRFAPSDWTPAVATVAPGKPVR